MFKYLVMRFIVICWLTNQFFLYIEGTNNDKKTNNLLLAVKLNPHYKLLIIHTNNTSNHIAEYSCFNFKLSYFCEI